MGLREAPGRPLTFTVVTPVPQASRGPGPGASKRVRRSLRPATGSGEGAGGERDLLAERWLEGSEGLSVAPRTLGEWGQRVSLSASPSPAPRPHPRRCHGFPLLSGSGAALQALLASRRRLLPAPAPGVDAGKGGARDWELWQGAERSPPPLYFS